MNRVGVNVGHPAVRVPRMRGDEPLGTSGYYLIDGRVPRMRGDEPSARYKNAQVLQCSPHARG